MTAQLTDFLGVETPIVLGPFGGASSVALTARVSERGGLGSFGLYGYAPDRIRNTVDQLRAATSRPIALNLWLPTGNEVAPADLDLAPYRAALAPQFAATGVTPAADPAAFLPPFEDQLEVVLDARPAVLSLIFGVPSVDLIDRAHRQGIRVVGAATTVAEARALEAGGVDAIVASGAESAGHRVSFLRPAPESLVGTFSLVPQIVDAVDVPVIAAGGIADRRGVTAAFALGAQAVQVGTAFLRAAESAVPQAHRDAIATATADGTVLTCAMSGRHARGIPNTAVREIEDSGVIAPFPAQNWLTGQFRAGAAARNDAEHLSLWAGQSSPLAIHTSADAIFDELAAGLPRR